MNRKILSISYYMPPLLFPRSVQIQRVLGNLAVLGWDSSVVTVDPESISKKVSRDNALVSLYPDSYRAELVPTCEDWIAVKAFFRLLPFFGKIPERQRVWIHHAVKRSMACIKENSFDAMITWANPMADHLVGLKIREKTSIPWIAHFSDPWVDNPYRKLGGLSRRLNERMERSIIERADHIVFTSLRTQSIVMEKYPVGLAEKTCVIPHCFEPKLFEDRSHERVSESRRDECNSFAHIGHLYGIRTANEVMEAFSILKRRDPRLYGTCSLRFIGNIDDSVVKRARQLEIDDIVQVIPHVSYLDSIRYMEGNDVLLLIESKQDSGMFFPSKLVDYMGVGNVILCVTHRDSVSAEVTRRANGLVADIQNVSDVYEKIKGLVNSGRSRFQEEYRLDMEYCRSYDVSAVSKQWESLIESVSVNSKYPSNRE